MIGIYKITNKLNNKSYIGQSKNIERRWEEHRKSARLNSQYTIHRAIRKYGLDNFSFEVLYECSEEELGRYEKFYIIIFGTYQKQYNMTEGGEIAISKSPEVRKKISIANTGKKRTEEYKQELSQQRKGKGCGKDNPMYGKIYTIEEKERMSKAQAGINNGNYGNVGSKNIKSKKISINGVEYIGLRETSRLLGLTYSTIKWRLNSNNYPSYFYI